MQSHNSKSLFLLDPLNFLLLGQGKKTGTFIFFTFIIYLYLCSVSPLLSSHLSAICICYSFSNCFEVKLEAKLAGKKQMPMKIQGLFCFLFFVFVFVGYHVIEISKHSMFIMFMACGI